MVLNGAYSSLNWHLFIGDWPSFGLFVYLFVVCLFFFLFFSVSVSKPSVLYPGTQPSRYLSEGRVTQ